MKARAFNGGGSLGQKIDAADGSNGGQCLTPETEGGDGGQVFGGAELGGGVAQKRGAGILGSHAAAVVRDPQEGHAAVADLDGDLGSTGVHGVFQQLLGNAGGPLHNLAGGDQIGHMGG